MEQLLYKLNALYGFYKSCHWLSKGEYFYQNHKLFGELYEGLDGEMDTLVELCLGYGMNDKLFDAKKIADETNKISERVTRNFMDNLKIAARLEDELLVRIEELEKKAPIGVKNHLANIAQNHSRNGYLIGRILEDLVESENE